VGGVKLKEELPNSFIVMVGTHPSALPEETLNLNDKIDAVARREYDYTIRDLADNLNDLSKVKGLSFRVGEEIIHNENRDLIQELDSLPFVSSVYKEHLDIKKYFFSAGQYPMVMIMTGRGCSARCTFCVYPQTFHDRTYRPRSPENVVAEFEYILKELPEVKSVGIEDDTFTLDKERVRKISQLLIDKGINKKINWWANARVNTLDFDTMKLMKEAGCRLLIPGYESGSQEILNNIKKGVKIENSIEFTKNAKRAGLLVHGCFMVGNPGETEETMRETLEFAKRLNIDTAQFFPLMVYPGTEAYDWAKNNQYLTTENYSDWLTEEGLHNCVLSLPDLPPERLTEFCNNARKEYYLRPKYILLKLAQIIRNPAELQRTLRSMKTFIKYL